jgi:hypothetical protein
MDILGDRWERRRNDKCTSHNEPVLSAERRKISGF